MGPLFYRPKASLVLDDVLDIGAQRSDARCLDRVADFEPSAQPPVAGPLSFEPKRPRRKGAGSSFVDWEPLAPVKNYILESGGSDCVDGQNERGAAFVRLYEGRDDI